ncbi:MAG: ABC transporter ATP-binding protein [Chloroflexi bacterium]|nr:ABC transporter ATP-binding protein [Chloroflexota bacterium]MBP8054356.1 ABC transporter ATP-binding protein [Chloroflexota bacterium]
MSQAVISFEHVAKSYHLGAYRRSLREVVGGWLRPRPQSHDTSLFWALDDVSFQVTAGEVLGLIGHNGAGKSTALKLLSQVTFPTRGRVHTQGRMAALIELGAGFHPDLSGRDNIYLNGAILGLKRREIEAQFDAIVAFAEIEKFIDTPVKRYSSGMYVRLAFAVAAHVQADLLLVDEVLSVGDAAFQQKSLDKMLEMRDRGVTILFVSHNLWNVSTFCHRVLLLDRGRIAAEGAPGAIIQQYRQMQREKRLYQITQGDAPEGEQAIITHIELLDGDLRPQKTFASLAPLIIRVHYQFLAPITHPVGKIRLRRADGLVCTELRTEGLVGQMAGYYQAHLASLQLMPDFYTVEASIIDKQKPILYVLHSGETFTVPGQLADQERGGVFQPQVEWAFAAESEGFVKI